MSCGAHYTGVTGTSWLNSSNACLLCFLYTCTAAQHEYSLSYDHGVVTHCLLFINCYKVLYNITVFQFLHIIIACAHASIYTYMNMHMYILYIHTYILPSYYCAKGTILIDE